ncbi:MAG: farnesyl diphosphate synthase [Thermodesulfobacteriota bacterium]|nr:farnesyl diphosphate synthase [Thermodesulfobacteriota bacterium]
MFNLETYLQKRRDAINQAINDLLIEMVPGGRLLMAMRHSLDAGGKRLRPVLCMAAAEAVGGSPASALFPGCAIEFIHTYSLIHDDLPAIDNDDMRRGRPACHTAFDEATAIFAGDALHTLAFEVLASQKTDGISPEQQLRIIGIIADATGNHGMIEGQMRDILAQGDALTIDDLRSLHMLKTGALIKAAVVTGALCGNGNERQIKALETYAANIGLAFQVTDDILDIKGNPELMGKAVGMDERLKKATYPGILGLDESEALVRELVEESLQAIDPLGKAAEPLRAVADYIAQRNH